MTNLNQVPVIVDEPNWAPLELAVPSGELDNYMYMGRVGEIELYKHRFTRRYLNVSQDGRGFYRYLGGTYVEISKSDALSYVRT